MGAHLPKDVVDDARNTDLVSLVDSYGVKLAKQGKDHFGLCPFHTEDTPSFTVYRKDSGPQKFCCMGCGAQGDAIQFVQDYEGLKFRDAVRRIVGTQPDTGNAPTKAPASKMPAEPEEYWTQITPVPDSVPVTPDTIRRKIKGEWVSVKASRRWHYRSADGETLGYVFRFDMPHGGKEVLPLVWAVSSETGECQWRWLSFSKPRPMYGLDRLAENPNAQVVVVEGEKAADAAQDAFADLGIPSDKLVAVAWPGGGKAIKHVDFSLLASRSVGLWPDADMKTYPANHEHAGVLMPFLEQPGTVAMLDVWAAIRESAASVKFFMPPEDVPDGWDLADPFPAGFSLLAHMKASAVDPAALMSHVGVPTGNAMCNNFRRVIGEADSILDAGGKMPAELTESGFLDVERGALLQMDEFERLLIGGSFELTELNEDGRAPVAASGLHPRLQRGAMPVGADARDGVKGTFPLTEMGNCHRIVAAHGDGIRFVPEMRAWLVWSGQNWLWDNDGARVRRLIGELANLIYAEGEHQFNDAEHFLKWARKSQEAKTIRNVQVLLEDVADLRIPVATIDGDPFLVGIDQARRVIDLRNGKCRAAARSDFVTRSLGVSEIGSAGQAIVWKRFLGDVFMHDADVLDWFKRFLGYCLTGCYDEQMFIFAHGGGSNGKSVLVKAMKVLAGEYCRTVAASSLMEQKRGAGDASPDIAELAGARLLLASETSAGSAFDEQFLKGWTGGDPQVARKLYRDQFSFEPVGKLFIAGNYRPRIGGTDYAIWRRVRLLPFERTFTDEEKDPAMPNRLRVELPHILAWAIEGCLDWQKRRLTDTPKVMMDAGRQYLAEQDVLSEFLQEMTLRGAELKVTSKELFDCYRSWMVECNLKPVSRQAFGRQLTERGFPSRHTNRGAMYDGLGLASWSGGVRERGS